MGVSRRAILKGLATAPLLASNTAASSASRTHIAVVGAGAFGGWTALHLLRMGAKVTLLDAWGPGNSRASSGGESRVIRGIYGRDRIYVQWVTRAFELWRENQRRWGTQLYRRTGLLWMFTADDEYARASLPIVREFGLRVDRLEAADAKRRFPQIDFDGVQSVYFEHEAGYLKARRACQIVCDQFEREGGTFQQAEVKAGEIQSNKLQGLKLSDGRHLAADGYVFACGPWLGKLFPKLLGDGISPSRQEVYYFGTPPGVSSFDAATFPVWIDFDQRLYYGIPDVQRRGIKVADDTRGAPFDPTNDDRTPTLQGVAQARKFLARRFPALASAPLLEARVCQYENSPDGNLIVDLHPEAQNVWIAGGGSGHGFKLSPALGEHVAQCALGLAEPDQFFSIERLTKLRDRSTQFDKQK